MTDEHAREPIEAITETTETIIKEYDEKTGTWTNIHVLVAGRAEVLGAWIS